MNTYGYKIMDMHCLLIWPLLRDAKIYCWFYFMFTRPSCDFVVCKSIVNTICNISVGRHSVLQTTASHYIHITIM